MKDYTVKKYNNGGHNILDVVGDFEKGSNAWWDAWLKEHKIKSKFKLDLGGEYLNVKKVPTDFYLYYDNKNNIFDLGSPNCRDEKIKMLESSGIFITKDKKDIYYKKPVEKKLKKGSKCYLITISGQIREVKFDDSERHHELIENKRLFSTFDAASKNTAKWKNYNDDIKYLGTAFTELLESATDIGSGLCNVDKNYYVICYKSNGNNLEICSKNIRDVNSNDEVFLPQFLKFNTEKKANLLIEENADGIEDLIH